MLLELPAIDPDEGIATLTHDWLAVPRPSAARIVAREDRLVRLARWGSDIRFEENITALRPGRALEWRFVFPDDSVSRHTDRHISPRGPVLRIDRGRYDLEALPGGKARLTLTVTFAMRSRLDWYLTWWGERLLGDISDNVLAIVAARAEHAPKRAA